MNVFPDPFVSPASLTGLIPSKALPPVIPARFHNKVSTSLRAATVCNAATDS